MRSLNDILAKTTAEPSERTDVYYGLKLPLNVRDEIVEKFSISKHATDTDVFVHVLLFVYPELSDMFDAKERKVRTSAHIGKKFKLRDAARILLTAGLSEQLHGTDVFRAIFAQAVAKLASAK